VGEVANKGWNVSDAAGNSSTVKPGDTVTFKPSNDNLTVAQENGTVTVGLSDTLNLGVGGSIALGDTVVNNDGLTIAGGPGITTGGISGGNKVITDVADGIASSDAVNKGQLDNAGSELTNKGLNIAGNSGTGHLNLGDTLTVRGEGTAAGTYSGRNLKTSVGEDGSLNIAMTESPTFGNVTINPDDSGRIGGVTDGVNPDDAVNKGQLDNAGSELTTKGLNIAGNSGTGHLNLGDTLTVRGEGTAAGTYSGKNLKTSVGEDGSLNIAMTESPTFGNVTINPDDSGRIGGVTDGVNPDDAVNKGQLDNAGSELTTKGLNLAGNSGTGHLNLGDTLTVRGEGTAAGTYSGKNLKTSVGEDGSLNIAMTESPTFGNVTINPDDSGRIGGVTDGVNPDDAVNKGQLDNVGEIANKGWNVADGAGNASTVKPGDTVTFQPSNDNLTVAQADGTVTVGLSDTLNLGAAGSIALGDTVINNDGLTIAGGPGITTGGVNAGNKVITDVADGVASSDAVNKGQLDNAGSELMTKGLNIAGNSGTGHLNLGDTLTVRGEGTAAGTYSGKNLKTSVGEDGSLNIAMTESPTFGNVTINPDDSGRIGGVTDGVNPDDAVNKGQLDNVGEIANRGWNVSDEAGNSSTVKPGDTVTFKPSNDNLTVAQENGTVTVGLSDTLNLGAAGSVALGDTVVNNDGLTIAGGPSVTTGGVNAGNKVITDVADGVASSDAVNKGQLDNAGSELTTKGLNLAGNAGTGHLNLGDTLTVKGEGTAAGTYSGKNLKTSVGEDGSLNIAMTESPTFGNVTINPDDSGRIGGVTDGVNPDDAVNKGQLDNVGEVANKGWSVADGAGNSSTVKPGDTVTFKPSNDNLTVVQENGTVTVGLSDTLNLGAAGSIALGDTVINNDGLTIAGGPGITTGGISGGNKVITDVADGVASSDAVNKGQLDNAGSELTNKGLNIAGNSGTGHLNLGDTLTVKGEGTAAGTYSGKNLKTSVGEDGSLNIAMTESPTFGNVTINPNDSGRIGGVTDGVNPDDAVNKGQLDNVGEVANRGWNVSDAAGNASTVKPGDTVTFRPSNDNLTVAQADGTVTVGLSDTLNLGAAGSVALGDTVVNNDGLTIANGPGITTGGISGGNKVITDVADGVASSDAVNKGQLDNAGSELTAKGLNIAGNSGTGHLNLGDTLTVRGEGTAAGTYSGKNLKTSVGEDGSLNIAMTESPTFGNVTINPDDSGRIGGVTDGVNPDDAVNKGQLDDVGEVANKGWNVSDAAGNASTVKPGDTVTFKPSNDNLTVAQADGMVTVGLANNLNLGDTGSLVTGNTTVNNDGLTIAGGPSITTGGISGGNKVITDVADGVASSDAVNKGQLDNVGEVANRGWNVSDAAGNSSNVKPGDTVTFQPSNDNLTVAQENGTVTVGLSDTLNLGAAGSIVTGNTTVNSDGLIIANGPRVTTGGISAGGKTITDVGAGVKETDAVNVGQLNSVGEIANKGWNVADGEGNTSIVKPGDTVTFKPSNDNLTVAQADGTVTVGLANNLNLGDTGSLVTGNTTVNNDGLTIANGPSITSGGINAGGKAITDVGAGIKDTDAVNVGQLNSAGGDLTAKGLNLAGNAGIGHLNLGDTLTVKGAGAAGGTYSGKNLRTEVGEDGSLNIVMNESPTFGTVTVNPNGDGRISGVTDGKNADDAVNKGQLDNVDNALTGKGLNLAGNVGSGHLNLGDTLTIRGEGLTKGLYSGANLRTTVDEEGNLNIAMAESPKFGNVTVNTDGSGRISGVADAKNADDAVNKGQLDNVGEVASRGWNVADGAGNTSSVKPGDTVTFKPSNDNLSIAQQDGTVTVGLANNLNLTDSGSVTIGSVNLNNSGLRIANGPSVTVDGIDAGGKKITNVADGTEDKDAVNYGQLKNWGGDIVNNINSNGIRYFHANSKGKDSSATGADAVAIGPDSVASGSSSIATGNGALASGAGSIASGHGSQATGDNAIATGTNASASGTGSIAMGNNASSKADNSVAIGSGAVVNDVAHNSVALGSNSVADRENTLSVGSKGNERQITNVANGKELTDAVNVGQLKGVESTVNNIGGNVNNLTEGREGMFQVNNTSKRSKPAPTGKDSLAGGAGAKASGNNSVSIGNNALASAENSMALGNNSSAKGKNTVALGTGSIADRDNTISVGVAGSERQITNVARGTKGTDAVNVDQLKQGIDMSNQYTDNKFGQLKHMVDKQTNKLSAGIAGAMAMATLPQPYAPGASMMAMSGGSYKGQSAVAIGVSTISDNGKWVSKLSGTSTSQGDFGVSVGVGYQW
ncbi:YadA-like family protein, partial [Pluralibacter gergoviae]